MAGPIPPRIKHGSRSHVAVPPRSTRTRTRVGVYVNALSDEGSDGVRRAYPREKLARLTELKNAYDPDNVFHLNQDIRPRQH